MFTVLAFSIPVHTGSIGGRTEPPFQVFFNSRTHGKHNRLACCECAASISIPVHTRSIMVQQDDESRLSFQFPYTREAFNRFWHSGADILFNSRTHGKHVFDSAIASPLSFSIPVHTGSIHKHLHRGEVNKFQFPYTREAWQLHGQGRRSRHFNSRTHGKHKTLDSSTWRRSVSIPVHTGSIHRMLRPA